MKYSTYMENATKLFDEGKISEETYDCMLMNAEVFCDKDEDYYDFLPDSYAEIEYDDFESAEAIEGARFDDMNYLRYRER